MVFIKKRKLQVRYNIQGVGIKGGGSNGDFLFLNVIFNFHFGVLHAVLVFIQIKSDIRFKKRSSVLILNHIQYSQHNKSEKIKMNPHSLDMIYYIQRNKFFSSNEFLSVHDLQNAHKSFRKTLYVFVSAPCIAETSRLLPHFLFHVNHFQENACSVK